MHHNMGHDEPRNQRGEDMVEFVKISNKGIVQQIVEVVDTLKDQSYEWEE